MKRTRITFTEMKCNVCGEYYPMDHFNKDKTKRLGIRLTCRSCMQEYKNRYYEDHKEEISKKGKERYNNNREERIRKSAEYNREHKEERKARLYNNPERLEKRRAYGRKYYKKHKDEIKVYHTEYYKKHRRRIIDREREYKLRNIEKFKAWLYEYTRRESTKIRERARQKVRLSDPHNRIAHNLRGRLRCVLKGKIKTGSAVDDLGCSLQKFIKHLESKFKPGMTWDNYGIDGWVVDHIIPLNEFDLTDREQLLKACNYINLQPLWFSENARKGCRVA